MPSLQHRTQHLDQAGSLIQHLLTLIYTKRVIKSVHRGGGAVPYPSLLNGISEPLKGHIIPR